MADISDLPPPPKRPVSARGRSPTIADLPPPPPEDLGPTPTSGNVRYGDEVARPAERLAAPTTPSDIPSVEPQKEAAAPSLVERGRSVLQSAGIGGVAGAFTPEIMKGLGIATMAVPQLRPASEFFTQAGRAAEGARIAGATAGMISGAGSEAIGQSIEAGGGGKFAAEAGRIIAGATTPEGIKTVLSPLGKAGGWAVSQLINKVLPGVGTGARTLGQLLEEKGVKDVSLTDQQRKFIQDKIASIRGGQPSVEPLKEVFGILQAATNRFIQAADADAAYLESQASSVLREAEAQGGAITQQFAKRASNLVSQFESSAQKIRDAASNQADAIIKNANDAAAAVRESAANKAPNIVSQAEQEANRIIQQGQTQADQMMSQARQREERLRSVSTRLRQTAAARTARAGEEISQVGKAVTPTELGTSLRNSFESEFQRLRGIREENVNKYKTQAFGDALAKEQAGKRYQETQAYRDSIEQINQELKNPETGLANVPSGEVRDSLTKVKDLLQKGIRTTSVDPATGEQVIKYQPLGFEALEKMRRSLRDRASGLPAEGYDAIGQQQAGRLAGYVENIQKEFSPAFGKYLDQYRIDSQPLNEFRNKVGKAMVGKEDFDFTQFKTDPATLGAAAFKTASSVQQLIGVAGKEKSEQFARTFLADQLRNAQSAKDVTKVLDDSRDWIGLFPSLKQQLSNVAESVRSAKTIADKRQKLSEALRTEMGKVIPSAKKEVMETAQTKAKEVKSAAEKLISESSTAVQTQRTALESEAKERAAKLTKEAEAKAAGLTKTAEKTRQEAQKQADLILGEKYDFKQVRSLLTSGTRDQWAAITPIIKADPQGKEKLAKAVSQVIADRAEQSLKGAIADWRDLSVQLIDNDLMSKKEADRIAAKLQEIFVTPVSAVQKSTLAQRLVRNAITGYVAPGAERLREKVME